MFSRRVGVVSVLVVSLVLAAGKYFPPTVAAGIGFQPVSSEELKMTSEPLAPGAPAIILYREVYRDDSGGTSHEDEYIRIKILTEEGRKYANVELPFLKGTEISDIHGRTIRPDGSIAEFDGKVLEQEVVKAKGVKVLAKTFSLPDAQPGSIIEYFYTTRYNEGFLFESHWLINEDLFMREAKFSLRSYEQETWRLALRWSWQNLPPGVDPPARGKGSDQLIRMDVKNVAAFQDEDYMPPADGLRGHVDFIYDNPIGTLDAGDYWKRFNRQFDGYLENFIDKRKVMEGAVAQIVSPNDPPEVKLRKIYDRVQQLRNISYEEDKTEQERKRQKEKFDDNVEQVWKRGYGHDWQLNWLYLALARAAGFDAYGCWVSDRRNYFFDMHTMQSRKLDENLVLIKMDGKDEYFDPGGAFTPFGLLDWSETGVPGLRLGKDDGTWIQTTLPKSSESQIKRVAKLKLSDTGDLEGKLTITYTGLEGLYHRRDMRHADDVARKKFLEERAKDQVPGAAEVELTNKPDWTASETPLVAEFDIKIPGWAASAGKRELIPVGIFNAAEKNIFEHANRVHPIYFEYPHEKLDDVTIELPSGWQVESIPPVQDQDKDLLAFYLKVEDGRTTVHLTRKLKIGFMMLDKKFYPALQAFFQGIRTADELQIVVQPGSTTAAN